MTDNIYPSPRFCIIFETRQMGVCWEQFRFLLSSLGDLLTVETINYRYMAERIMFPTTKVHLLIRESEQSYQLNRMLVIIGLKISINLLVTTNRVFDFFSLRFCSRLNSLFFRLSPLFFRLSPLVSRLSFLIFLFFFSSSMSVSYLSVFSSGEITVFRLSKSRVTGD